MFSLKPFIKTLLISFLIFFLFVFLGIKYHWARLINNETNNITLTIPEASALSSTSISVESADDGFFQAELMPVQELVSKLSIMSKKQIKQNCQELFAKTGDITDALQLDLLVGNCVVSNFQEPYQELKVKTTYSQQHRAEVETSCRLQINQQYPHYPEIDKQLLTGVCISNELIH